MAARLEEAGEDAEFEVVIPADGGPGWAWTSSARWPNQPSLTWLRVSAAMLPRIDLPELLLEVHSWTGFLDAFTHGSTSTRMDGL